MVMKKRNPFRASFDEAKKYSKYSNFVLSVSTILLGMGFGIKILDEDLSHISDFISSINSLFIIAFIVLSFLEENSFYNASIDRRSDFVDNSFKSSLSEHRSDGYYSNESIVSGIYKMAVNGFENSFFTYNISKEITKSKWIKNSFFIIVVLIFAVFGFSGAFVLLLQLTLPILLLQQAIRHTLLVIRINRVYENYRRLFNDLKDLGESKYKQPEIILNVLDYETILTFGAILLDSKIFDKLNPSLSGKWEVMKKEYKIEVE